MQEELQMKGFVYKAVVADKIYIGKTTGSFEGRVKTHINHAFVQRLDTKIAQALRTLKREEATSAFSIIEEIEHPTYDELEKVLCERENFYMRTLDTIFPNGYNVAKSYPSKRRVVKTQPPRESVMRKVICLETGKTFRSMAEASRFANVDISSVYHCLKGVNNTSGGYHWMYADGEYHKCERPEGGRNKKSQSKPVMCKETKAVYPSIGEASRQTGICSSNIAKCANGRVVSAGGFKWGFVVDGKPVFKEREDRNKSRIKCLETGEVFESMTACARSLGEKNAGTLRTTIECGCKHKGRTYVRI
jgi:hypothetical protein